MRVRISLLAPFSDSKFLLSLPEEVQTISQLKRHLYTSLSSISNVVSSSKEIKLEIDGFELLAGSGVDVLRDGDVVLVSTRSGSSTQSQPRTTSKRRSVSLDTQGTVKKQRRTPSMQVKAVASSKEHAPGKEMSKSRSPPSSTSSASSSSSSSSISSSSSPSSSSSGSSSPHPSSVKLPNSHALHPTINPFPVLANGIHTDNHVPPGQGKAETKNRNARRRRSRQYKRAEAEGASPSPVNGVGVAEIGDHDPNNGARASGSTNDFDAPVEGFTRLPNANRNKKKGFFKDMMNQKGVRTTFGDEDGELGSPTVNGHVAAGPSNHSVPSEPASRWNSDKVRHHFKLSLGHPDLPSNVFITSVDFGKPGPSSARAGPSIATRSEHHAEEIQAAAENPVDDTWEANGNSPDKLVRQEDLWNFRPEEVVRIAERIEPAFYDSAFAPITQATALENLKDKHLVWMDVVLIGCSPQQGLVLAKVVKVNKTLTGDTVTVRLIPIDRDGEPSEPEHIEEFDLTKEELLVPAGDFKSDYRIIEDMHPYLGDLEYVDL